MRKGRSQRKARASLPPRTARQTPSRPDVVAGTTTSRSDSGHADHDEAREARDARAPQASSGARPHKQTLELFAEPALELLRQSEPIELPPVRAALPPVTVTPMTDAPEAASAEASEPAPAPAPAPRHLASMPTPDEMSIPPVGDLSVEPVADRFFSEGEIIAARGADGDEHEWDAVTAPESRKHLPEVAERRAHLAKYVRWAVAGAALVCVAALGRTLVAPAATQAAVAQASAAASAANVMEAPSMKAASPAAAAEPAVAPVAPTAEPAAAAPPATPEPAKAAEVAAAPAAEPERVDAPKVEIPKAEAPAVAATPTSDKTALQEKNDCRRLLERGKPADAIAAGERSVALDPTDGEAWLLLGAAYQDKGNMAEARRAYASCTKEGKRGPLGECRAMLR